MQRYVLRADDGPFPDDRGTAGAGVETSGSVTLVLSGDPRRVRTGAGGGRGSRGKRRQRARPAGRRRWARDGRGVGRGHLRGHQQRAAPRMGPATVPTAVVDDRPRRLTGEQTASRLGYRAGYYSRGLVTRIGKLELRVPRGPLRAVLDRAVRPLSALSTRARRDELLRVLP